MTVFVFTKPGVEAGESLAAIVARKESERIAGQGTFWWGVGTSLGASLQRAAHDAGGTLPIIFLSHKRPISPKQRDATPQRVVSWTKWQDRSGLNHTVPAFANVTSRWDQTKQAHYALVCHSEDPIKFDPNGPEFDATLCRTALDKVPGSSQVTALVRGPLDVQTHKNGSYRIVFRAVLKHPWQARLVSYR
jgi:hypothetical protein